MEIGSLIKIGSQTFAVGKDMLKALGLPSANELGQMWADRIRARRLVRLASISKKVEVELRRRGVDPRQVPDSFGIPFLNTATLVEDEELQQRWAALLATTCDPRNELFHATAFVDVLGQLSPFEANLLDWAEEFRRDPPSEEDPELQPAARLASQRGPDWDEISTALSGLTEARFAEIAVNLERLGLVVAGSYLIPTRSGMSRSEGKSYTGITLTPFGRAFVRACRPVPPGPTDL